MDLKGILEFIVDAIAGIITFVILTTLMVYSITG